MLSRQEQMLERQRTLENDLSVQRQQREAGSTLTDHTRNEMGGRFEQIGQQTITGKTPAQQWPKLPASSPWAGPDIIPPEPAFGVPIFAVREWKP